MPTEYKKGTIVLAEDPYTDEHKGRPFLVISESGNYPVEGNLGVPLTSKEHKEATIPLTESDIAYEREPLHQLSSVNPLSPHQVNEPFYALVTVTDEYVERVCEAVGEAIGL